MFATAISALPQLSYLGLFIFTLGGAVFVPIPEEVTLLTAGYLVATGTISVWLAIPLAILGLFIGDIVLFFLAKIGSSYAKKLRERVNKIGLERTWIFDPRHPLRAIFSLRFLTGFRFIAPIYAGFEQVAFVKYALTNTLALLIFVPGMFALGYAFHANELAFIASFEIIRHAVFIVVLALAGSGLLPSLYKKLQSSFHREQ